MNTFISEWEFALQSWLCSTKISTITPPYTNLQSPRPDSGTLLLAGTDLGAHTPVHPWVVTSGAPGGRRVHPGTAGVDHPLVGEGKPAW